MYLYCWDLLDLICSFDLWRIYRWDVRRDLVHESGTSCTRIENLNDNLEILNQYPKGSV